MLLTELTSAMMVFLAASRLAAGAPAVSDPIKPIAAPSCVVGAAAATGAEGSWQINFASVTPLAATQTSYGVDKTWSAQHAMMTMVSKEHV